MNEWEIGSLGQDSGTVVEKARVNQVRCEWQVCGFEQQLCQKGSLDGEGITGKEKANEIMIIGKR